MPRYRERKITNWIMLDVAARLDEVGGEEAIRGKDPHFTRKSKQMIIWKVKEIGTRLSYYGILQNKTSMPLKRNSKERIRKKTKKKMSHEIAIVM